MSAEKYFASALWRFGSILGAFSFVSNLPHGFSHGFSQDFEVGQAVIAIRESPLATLDGSLASVFPGLPLQVQRIDNSDKAGNAASRLLVSNGTPGWISSEEVRLPEEALRYCGQKMTSESKIETWLFAEAMILAFLNRHEEAVARLDQLLIQSPSSTAYLNERAVCYLASKKFDLALKDFDVLVALQPVAKLLNNRGLCRRASNDIIGAREDFQKAIELDPGLEIVYQQLASLEASANDPKAALIVCDQYIARFPQQPWGFTARSSLNVQLNLPDAALADLDKLIELTPDDVTAYVNRAILLRNLGKIDDSVSALSKVIERFPKSDLGYINRATIYEDREQWQEALTDYDKALEFTDEYRAYLSFRRGGVKMKLDDYQGAVDDLTIAIELSPKSSAFARRGEVYAKMSDYTAAIANFDTAISMDPQDHLTYYHRAKAYQSDGNDDKALAAYNQMVDQGISMIEVFYARGHLLKKQKNWSAAISDLSAARELNSKSMLSTNDLAWLLATVPVAELRDAKRAIELATEACEMTNWNSGLVMDTLAVAHGAAGDFAKATEIATRALHQPDALDNAEIKEHLASFKEHKAVTIR